MDSENSGDVLSTSEKSSSNPNGEPSSQMEMKKHTTLLSGTGLIVGAIIGSGIFISPVGVFRDTGSVGVSLLIWALAGGLAMTGALVYAELGSTMPKSGATYAYLLKVYGPLNKVLGPIPAFLYVWMFVFFSGPGSTAIVALTFGQYSLAPFYDACGPPEVVVKMLAVALLGVAVFLNVTSVKGTNRAITIFFALKVLALVTISIGGIYALSTNFYPDTALNSTSSFQSTKTLTASTIALAFYKAGYAYQGWDRLNFITEELKNPDRNIPLAISLAIPLVTLLYILANVSYFAVLPVETMLQSNVIASSWTATLLPSVAWLGSALVATSTAGSSIGNTLGFSRMMFAASREGHMYGAFSLIHVDYLSPILAIAISASISVVLIFISDVFTLINAMGSVSLAFFALSVGSMLILRYREPNRHRPFKCPWPIAVIVLLLNIFFAVAPLIDRPSLSLMYAWIFVLGGVIFYFPFVYFKLKIPGIDQVTCFLQSMLRSVPPKKYKDLDASG